jgi:RHS repeat-associated protein
VDNGGVASIVQWETPGPWGESLGTLTGSVSTTFANPYVYTGHERMGELGVYDAKARVYDPIVPRFWQIDPLAEKFYAWSPYNYTFDSPIRLTDPTGMGPEDPWYKNVLDKVSNFFKGADAGTNQRYQTEPARGATVTGIRDTQGGKVRNGSPVGVDVVRVDNPHGSVKTPHINVNPSVTGVPDPHTPITRTTLRTLEGAGKTIEAISKVAKPVAIVTDAIRLGVAVNADGGTLGSNTIKTSASVAGGWAGALGGAALGAKGGAAVGSLFGPGPGTVIGGFVGGIGGSLVGSFGGSSLSEKVVETVTKKKE